MSGAFITLEGPDGSGKTTAITLLQEKMKQAKIDFVKTREPGGSPVAEEIRDIVLGHKNEKIDPKTEALLIAGARRQHIVETILPALRLGKLVLCDRFIDSSLAYQGAGRNIGIEEVLAINLFAIEKVFPSRTYYLDLPASMGLARIALSKGREVNRLDKEDLAFHKRVKEGYEKVLAMFPDRIVRIDACKPPEQVAQEIFTDLLQHLKN